MFIRCADNCKYQEDGVCGLKNTAGAISSSGNGNADTGCVYYKPKNRADLNTNDNGIVTAEGTISPERVEFN
ncbi:hypothetical protein FACS1894219_05390 [Clostridia bacterium]|nr:hypothetical protein FACS1894219_05390 [Clostridia bacterium]